MANRTALEGLVPAVFSTRAAAEAAIGELRQLGLTAEHVGVAVPDPVHHGLARHEDLVGQKELEGASAGFILGAPLGAIAGIALTALVVGGLGPLGLGGILVAGGVGAIYGVVLGSEAGLIARVRAEEEAPPHWSEIPLSQTDILVVARAGDRSTEAHGIMVRHGARCFCLLDRLERPRSPADASAGPAAE
jgi:hypothetical protein